MKLPTIRENFVKIVQRVCRCDALVFHKLVKFSVWGPHTHPSTDGVIFGVKKSTSDITPLVQFVTLWGKNTQKHPRQNWILCTSFKLCVVLAITSLCQYAICNFIHLINIRGRCWDSRLLTARCYHHHKWLYNIVELPLHFVNIIFWNKQVLYTSSQQWCVV